jgi:hypothetical protein
MGRIYGVRGWISLLTRRCLCGLNYIRKEAGIWKGKLCISELLSASVSEDCNKKKRRISAIYRVIKQSLCT